MADEIDVLDSEDDLDDLPPCSRRNGRWTAVVAPLRTRPVPEPIIVRGVGQFTMFGLSSRFDSEFPPSLTGKVAPEELQETIQRVNFVLQRTVVAHFRWLLCGFLFCCCTCGCSLWPVVCLSKKTVLTLEKTLDCENQQLYNKLGFHWRLAKMPVQNTNGLTEYVMLLETLPRVPLLLPD